MRSFLAPNRIAVYLTAIAAVSTAVAPLVADLDTTSTSSLVAGLAAIVVVVFKYLTGWQQFESRQDLALQGVETAELPPTEPTDVPADFTTS